MPIPMPIAAPVLRLLVFPRCFGEVEDWADDGVPREVFVVALLALRVLEIGSLFVVKMTFAVVESSVVASEEVTPVPLPLVAGVVVAGAVCAVCMADCKDVEGVIVDLRGPPCLSFKVAVIIDS